MTVNYKLLLFLDLKLYCLVLNQVSEVTQIFSFMNMTISVLFENKTNSAQSVTKLKTI